MLKGKTSTVLHTELCNRIAAGLSRVQLLQGGGHTGWASSGAREPDPATGYDELVVRARG